MNRLSRNLFACGWEADEYDKLQQQVRRRDGWKYQLCRARCNLEVHHKKFLRQLAPKSLCFLGGAARILMAGKLSSTMACP